MSHSPMLPGFAGRVFDVLVTVCGAIESDRASFIYEFEKKKGDYGPTSEWRFGGAFGFGGKFRYPRFSVDAYPENMTAEIESAKLEADKKLAIIKEEMISAGWNEYGTR